MRSLILNTATRYLLPLILLFSVFLLLYGHHEPGGGFIGGLVVSAAVALCALGFGVSTAQRILPIPPPQLIGTGLLIAASSGAWALFCGKPFLTAVWGQIPGRGNDQLHIGTPLLFDLGVYVVVVGVVLLIVFTLAEAVDLTGAQAGSTERAISGTEEGIEPAAGPPQP